MSGTSPRSGRPRAGRWPDPTEADLRPLFYAVPMAEKQRAAQGVLRPLLTASENLALTAAAVEASQGPKARARAVGAEFAWGVAQDPRSKL